MKKNWKKPELIVLVRLNSGEAVLGDCKHDGTSPGPTGNDRFGVPFSGFCQNPATPSTHACRGSSKT